MLLARRNAFAATALGVPCLRPQRSSETTQTMAKKAQAAGRKQRATAAVAAQPEALDQEQTGPSGTQGGPVRVYADGAREREAAGARERACAARGLCRAAHTASPLPLRAG